MSEDLVRFLGNSAVTVIVAVCGVLTLWIKLRNQDTKIEQIQHNTNSMSQDIARLSREKGHAEGVLAEKARTKEAELTKNRPASG